MTSPLSRAILMGAPLAALALAMPAFAQQPTTYSYTESTNALGGPMTIRVARDGSREFMDEAGQDHATQLFDFAAHKLYTVNLKNNDCTVENYPDPGAPPPLDPLGGAQELTREMLQGNPKPVGSENVNGMPATVYEFSHPSGEKLRLWIANANRFPVKVVVSDGKGHSETQLEIRDVAYTSPPANLFTPPAGPCRTFQPPAQNAPSNQGSAPPKRRQQQQ